MLKGLFSNIGLSDAKRVPNPYESVEAVPIESIHPAPWNAREIGDEELEGLKKSITEDPKFLWYHPPFVRKQTMEIYAGTQRWLAAKELGYETIPCIITDCTEEEAKTRNAKHNRHHGKDDRSAKDFLIELSEMGVDLSTVGRDIVLPNSSIEIERTEVTTDVHYRVIVDVENAEAQQSLFEDLRERGYKCKCKTS